MKKFTGIINGLDVQTVLPRTQAFVVDKTNPDSYIQVTTYDDGLYLMLAIASWYGVEVTVEYDDSDSENRLNSIVEDQLDRLDLAKQIARLKNVKTEDTVDNGKLTRVRILDR